MFFFFFHTYINKGEEKKNKILYYITRVHCIYERKKKNLFFIYTFFPVPQKPNILDFFFLSNYLIQKKRNFYFPRITIYHKNNICVDYRKKKLFIILYTTKFMFILEREK
jgi:hypothetical protein